MIIFGINLFTSDLWLLGICGTLIMALIVYRLSLNVQRYNTFNVACDIFIKAFTPELAALKMPSLDENSDPHGILHPSISKHRTAMIEFRRCLGFIRKRLFDRAWYEYYTYDNTGEETTDYLLKYSSGWEGNSIRECRNLAISNIERLLKFAKHK